MIQRRIAGRKSALALALASGVGLVALPARAATPTVKEVCVSAYERAQDLRRTGKLIDAREALITCSQPTCPAAATVDCARWLGEVEQSLPSVVVSARDASGREVSDLRVLVDGIPLATAPSGRATPIDPGAHTFRYESSRGPSTEERVTIREGEKNRAVSVILGAAPGPAAAPPSSSSVAARPIPMLAWVLGGVGLAGLVVLAGVGASSFGDESALRGTCAPRCAEDDVAAIRVKHTIADIGLGVGVASLGVATWLILTRPVVPAATKPSASRTLELTITGSAATLRGTF
ncbi:MAG: hypothetical protein ACMG6S_27840 [Byssovorax sp.]